ncbi:MAG TPA: tripartite tricarboxylate transporter substrate-binding protein [Acetobacteraceae bacterium]|nr:tripartite tricarboxylate transporter substrate-binding protein [Acetobacteraceae bacterium]
MIHRRSLALIAGTLAAPHLAAQERFPNRPIRMVIPVGVGGVTDVVGRILAEGMSPLLGRPVVPENIPGAGSRVGAAAFHRLPADGYAVMIGTNNHPVMRAIDPNFPLDPVSDFVPLALVGRQPFVLAVHPDVPARDLAALLAWLRQQGDTANYGATNPGASNHLAGELFKQLTGTRFTIVPYRTAANAVQDLVAGRMQFTIDSPTMLNPLMREGRVRGIAVSSMDSSTLVPGLPGMRQAGLADYDMTAWQILFARPGTPAEILAVLEAAARRAVADATIRQRLAQAGVDVWPDSSPAAAVAHLREEVARWAPIVARMNLAGG